MSDARLLSLRNALFGFAWRGAGLALTFLSSLLAARVLGPVRFGVFSVIVAACSMSFAPAQSAVLAIRLRVVGSNTADSHRNRSLAIAILVALCLSLLSIVVALPNAGEHAASIGIVVVASMLGLFVIRISADIAADGQVVRAYVPDQFIKPAASALGMYFVGIWVGSQSASVNDVVLVTAGASVASLVAAIHFRRVSPDAASDELSTRGPEISISALLGLMSVSGVQQLMAQGEVLFLARLVGGEDLGQYRVAYQFGILASVGLMVLNTQAAPTMASLWRRGEDVALRACLRTVAREGFVVASIVLLGYMIFGSALIHYGFGPEYREAWKLGLILLSGHVGAAFFGAPLTLMQVTRGEVQVLRFAAIWVPLYFTAVFWCTVAYSVTGIAVAVSVGTLAWRAAVARKVFAVTGVRTAAF